MKRHRIPLTIGLALLGIVFFVCPAQANDEDLSKEIEKKISEQLGAQFEFQSYEIVSVYKKGKEPSTLEKSKIKITAITKETLYQLASRHGNGKDALRVSKAVGDRVEFLGSMMITKTTSGRNPQTTVIVHVNNPKSYGQPLSQFPSQKGSAPGSPPQASVKPGAEKSASSGQKDKKAEPFDAAKIYDSVYGRCVSDNQWSIEFVCDCLAQKVVALYPKEGPEANMDILVAEAQQNRSCRNIPGTIRQEYAKCMGGSGFDYENIPQQDYCECYSQSCGKLFGEYEGRLDSYKKSSLRGKARTHCLKPGAYKDKH